MTSLLVDNFKLIVLTLWIGSMVGLAKFGNAVNGKHARTAGNLRDPDWLSDRSGAAAQVGGSGRATQPW